MTAKQASDVRDARRVIAQEICALKSLRRLVGTDFARAVAIVGSCKGRVVATGMGKAGLIAQKVSATLASTGTPSHFLHPAEALHGDLGRITSEDVVLAFSNSGETEEMVRLLPAIHKIGATLICVTADRRSTLARHCDVAVPIGRVDEACPLGLAPSASTTAMLALGDALALTVQKRRGLSKQEFAFYHPGGDIGRRLLRVEEIMRPLREIAVVRENATAGDAVKAICAGRTRRTGAACVVGRGGRLVGILTDGDVRRRLSAGTEFVAQAVRRVMTPKPITVTKGALAADAFKILKARRIDELPVVDRRGKLLGVVDVQDLLDTVMV